jgi:hypothetical protein
MACRVSAGGGGEVSMFNRGAAVLAAAAVLGVALVALPATAAAVGPSGGHYAQSKDNVVVATFDVAGGKVRRFWHSDDCARYSVPVPAMKIGGNGAFSFTGTGIKNGISQEYSVKVSGHAVSRTVIAGSMTYQKTAGNGPACKTTTKFRAKRTGPARS